MNASGSLSLTDLFGDNLNECYNHTCTITSDMVTWLNLTSNFTTYFQAYCLNPPNDDGCPFGYCPNPDIAGPLVRISAYVTNVCLCLLIFYSPEDSEESFWAQILTIYSLLITCAVSIFQGNLTRFHAVVANVIVASPLTIYLALYALGSMWNPNHRLRSIMGKGKVLQRLVTIIAFGFWIFLLVYILLPSHISRFAQESCVKKSSLSPDLGWLPLVLFLPRPGLHLVWIIPWLFLGIPVVFWIFAILKQRRKIWHDGEGYKPRFIKVWKIVGKQYPFVHFTTLVLTPMAYWIAIVELGTMGTPDDYFSLSYGQVLACFVTLPALISVAQLYRKCYHWFINLTWVRLITGRRREYPDTNAIHVSLTGGEHDEESWQHVGTEYERPVKEKGDHGQYSEIHHVHDA